jgi:drug/metabolite transporter (DMT)-like permease
MARCESAIAGLVASMIEPAIAACLAFVFLNEVLTDWQMLGCMAILASMLLLTRRDRVVVPAEIGT